MGIHNDIVPIIRYTRSNLRTHKAAGPDQLRPIIITNCSIEIAPILQVIYGKAVHEGDIPETLENDQRLTLIQKWSKNRPC